MKTTRIFIITAVVAASVLFASCKSNQKKAEEVAYNYAYAMANYQVSEAAKYASEETKNTTLVMAERLVKAVDQKYIQSDTPAKVEIMEVKITDDTVGLAIFHKTTPIKDMMCKLNLRKRDGKWVAYDTIPSAKGNEE